MRNFDWKMACVALVTAAAPGVRAQQRPPPPEPQPQTGVVRTEVAYPTGDRATSVVLLERFTPREVRAGMELEYQIRLTNLIRGDLQDVVLVEQFPPGFAPQASDPKASLTAERTARWTWPRLAAGTTQTIRVRGVTSTAEELYFCATLSVAATACAGTSVVEPRLLLAKTLSPEVLICEPILMRLTVSNGGSGVMRNVRITDPLPEGLTTTDGRRSFAITVGDLPAGQSRAYTVELRATRTGAFANTAQAEEDGGQRTDASARIVVRQPVLAITKRGPDLRYVGRVATFEITVRNAGDAPARDTVLTDLVPPGADIIAADGGQVADGQVRWNLGTLAPRDARTVKLTVRPNAIGTLQTTARAEAYCAETAASATLTVAGISAILLEVVDDPDPIEVGGAVTYTIEVTNQGSAPSTNIVIDCALPAELQYVSASGPARGMVDGQNIRFAPLATLAPRARVTYTVVATGTREADARIKVTMKSDQTTSPVEETESTHIY